MEKRSLNRSVTRRKIIESRLFSQLMPVILLLALVALFANLTKGSFVSAKSIKIIVEQALIVGTVATGAAFIFASGNVNLAMGATTVLTATLAGMIYNATGSVPLMILAAIAVAVVIMIASVLLSTALGVGVLFVTFVMMSLLSALQQSILGGSTISLPYEMIRSLADRIFMYIAFALYFLCCAVLFHSTAIGRALKFIGTNDVCAEQTGISKNKYMLIAFLIAGIGSGIGACLVIARSGSIGVNTQTSLNMDVMLALVLGGMSVFGGSRSNVYAGIVGSLTVCVLNQGMVMIGVDAQIIQAIRGIIFIALVTVSQTRPKGLPAPEG